MLSIALAHEGTPVLPGDVWRAWNWDPAIVIALLVTALVFGRGLRMMGARRGGKPWRAWAGMSGLAALVVALVSPIDALGETLFSAHMVQHLLLMVVAAPLLVAAAPMGPLLLGLPRPLGQAAGRWWRRSRALRASWRGISRPWAAWALHAVALWAWHAPPLYELALRSEWAHVLEHFSFLGTALLFWWILLHPGRDGLDTGRSILYLFTMGLQGGLLGALLTFASFAWYDSHLASAAAFGLTPLEDQQLAGVIMWVPVGIVYLGAALFLMWRWLEGMERQTEGVSG